MKSNLLDSARLPGAWRVAALSASLLIGCASSAIEPHDTIVLPKSSPFPESVTVAADKSLYVSSISHGGVLKILPGSSTSVPFIKPGEHGTRSTFGVYADDKRSTLWVASNDASAIGLKGPTKVEGSWIKGFDLNSGALKVSVQLPSPAIANDFALGEDGSLYVTNTAAPQILRLRPGAKTVEVFVQDDALKGGLDGIAFGQDGNLYVNTYASGELFRINMKSDAPGKITKLKTSRPLSYPDGLRPFKDGFLMVEGSGSLDRLKINGDYAAVETIANVAGPTGLWLADNRIWIAEGQLSLLSAESAGKLPENFKLRALPIPTR